MSHPKISLALIGSLAVVLGGCGGGGNSASLPRSLSQVPLVPGGQIVARARQCDRGANGFCAVELVLVNRGYSSSGALVTAERSALKRTGWLDASGDFGDEHAADSPGHKLHLTYATALIDLTGVDEEWIKRPRALTLVLSREVFARVPAMTVTLEAGPA